jgi:hypothetical protein
MHRERRLISAVTVTGGSMLTLGLCLTACGLVGGTTFSDDAAVSGAVSSVRIDNEAGSVTVRGAAGANKVSVHRTVRYRGGKPGGKSYEVADGELTLHGCGSKCAVSYTVTVPAGTPVNGANTAGTVHLSDVGAVDVTTSSGGVQMERVHGTVRVTTSDGAITGSGLAAPRIDTRTSNGTISLAATVQPDVTAKADNGAITLTVPNKRYRVSTTTSNGSRQISVATDPNADHRLDLKTSNGAITVKTA